jgi:hypothetical protein
LCLAIVHRETLYLCLPWLLLSLVSTSLLSCHQLLGELLAGFIHEML